MLLIIMHTDKSYLEKLKRSLRKESIMNSKIISKDDVGESRAIFYVSNSN